MGAAATLEDGRSAVWVGDLRDAWERDMTRQEERERNRTRHENKARSGNVVEVGRFWLVALGWAAMLVGGGGIDTQRGDR